MAVVEILSRHITVSFDRTGVLIQYNALFVAYASREGYIFKIIKNLFHNSILRLVYHAHTECFGWLAAIQAYNLAFSQM